MELCSLHPFDEIAVRDLVVSLVIAGDGDRNSAGYRASYAMARSFAGENPSYAHPGISLTTWEARVDRGIGMLMRPPSRLLIDAGADPVVARQLPIRLELNRGMMGGAYIPARLVAEFGALLERRVERTIARLNEAEWDGVAVLGMMLSLAGYAESRGLAIFEAMDVITDDGAAPGIAGAVVIGADRKRLDRDLRERLERAAKPANSPGLFARMTRRGRQEKEESRGGG